MTHALTTPLKIAFCAEGTPAAPWIDGLRAALPGAEVWAWEPGAPQADHAVVWKPPQRFLDEQAGLRGIFNLGAGVDALLASRLPPQALVVRLDDAGMSVQMAEFVVQGVVRRFRELDAYAADTAAGRWGWRKPRRRADFHVGVLGLGVLGQRVARALQTFEFPVRGWSRSPKAVEGVECFAGEAQLGAFLAGCQVVVCLLPLTPDTQDILRRETLQQLPQGAYVINVARGGHLVDEDLLALIDSGHLSGALLDVFRTEPLPAGHPYWSHPQVTITPHVAAVTLRHESIAQIAGKIAALERGERIGGVVDRAKGY